MACPHIGQVMAYDQAIRDLAFKLMKTGTDFETALGKAMGDADTRTLHFTTPFGMEATTPACTALSAPGLREIYSRLPRQLPAPSPKKRALPVEDTSSQAAVTKSASAKKRARQSENKKKKLAELTALANAGGKGGVNQPPVLAIEDRRANDARRQDKPKGGKAKGGKGTIPSGIKSKSPACLVCFSFNKGEKCVQKPCTFQHVCWWCHGDHRGGDAKTAQCQ